MKLNEQQIVEALRAVSYPGFQRDIVTLGLVRGIRVSSGIVDVELDIGPGNPAAAAPIEHDAVEAILRLTGIESVRVRFRGTAGGSPALRMAGERPSPGATGALDAGLIPGVRRTIAVASGKGGVGKSTIAVNLAAALADAGARVGLLDADVYGPSIPLMTGIDDPPRPTADGKLAPFERFGLRIMSLGFLVERDTPVIWRGPMVMKALEQLLGDVDWGDLDFLVVDMPPGTGDAQLTLSQKVRLAGAVIVTTPQDVALADARKGVAMFQKVSVPVLGIVENMSYFRCPHCAERTEIFGCGGGRTEAERLGVPFLGDVPLDPAIRIGSDTGEPVVKADPSSAQARALIEIATRVRAALEDSTDARGPSAPQQG